MAIEWTVDAVGNILSGKDTDTDTVVKGLDSKIKEIGNWIDTEEDDMSVVKAKRIAQEEMYRKEFENS
jgi:hypothetical protein